MFRLAVLVFTLSSQLFAAEQIHVTGPGTFRFSETTTDFDVEYNRVGIPESACVDVCDQFGCNRVGSGGTCSETSAMPTPINIRDVVTDIELEILPPPEGMVLDEHFEASSRLNFKGSKKFAFLKTTKWVSNGAFDQRFKITLKPLDLKAVLNSVALDKHVYLKKGVFTYTTLGAGPLKVSTHLSFERKGYLFTRARLVSLSERELAPHRTSAVTAQGLLKHAVDLNKVLEEPMKKGKWIMTLTQRFDNSRDNILVEQEFQDKLEGRLFYTMKVR